MPRRILGAAALALTLAGCAEIQPEGPGPSASRPPAPPAPSSQATSPPSAILPLAALPGWKSENHAAAFSAYRQTCNADRRPDSARVCAAARATGLLDGPRARAFFERHFIAEGRPDEGLLTAYYTPIYPARRTADAQFAVAVRAPPPDLKAGVPYLDRASIEARQPEQPLAWLRPEDLFFLQVQGSGVLAFEDGRRMKALYAATNGRPYLAIGKVMRDQGLLAAEDTSAGSIHRWLADHRGPEADALMRRNPRYAFFTLRPDDGRAPAGSAGVPLPARRALAVDPTQHPMGELLWVDADQPALAGARPSYAGLALALDTGGAIRGAGRADLYLGAGSDAGAEAGLVRHRLRLYRLVPRNGSP